MISTLLTLLPLLAPPSAPDISWEASPAYVQGQPYGVSVSLTVGAEGSEVPAWVLSPAGFEVNGKPLGKRGPATLALPAGAKLDLAFDLGPHLAETGSFAISYATDLGGGEPVKVTVFRAASAELDFWQVPAETLGSYQVLMETVHGTMMFEVYPDSAPNHVRNFLDLNHRGFYEGLVFHRVSPNFMIQGGDPYQRVADSSRWTGGKTTKKIDAEFNERKHVRGILSAARTQDPNSATSQFFVMTAPNAGLDGKYSVFGKMLSGDAALTAISKAPGRRGNDGTVTPEIPQQILRTYVLVPN